MSARRPWNVNGRIICIGTGLEQWMVVFQSPEDARLAGAAPDLLAACEQYLWANEDGIGDMVEEAEALIRLAVEKARGPRPAQPAPSWANPRDLEPIEDEAPF